MAITNDPETMTTDERYHEIANILAAGLLRCVRQAKHAVSTPCSISPPESAINLDLLSEMRLSVAQRPTG